MNDNHPQPVENYTDAFLATAGGILVMGFWVIAALAGYLWVALIAWAINRAITWLGARSGS